MGLKHCLADSKGAAIDHALCPSIVDQVSHGQEWLEVFASSLSPRTSALDSLDASGPHPPGPFPESFCKGENEGQSESEHCGQGEVSNTFIYILSNNDWMFGLIRQRYPLVFRSLAQHR